MCCVEQDEIRLKCEMVEMVKMCRLKCVGYAVFEDRRK